ncbi:hypothetical protein EDB85DRAFT_1289153 [Lactarius pseudohatsudake]|nr:hypothetical protein EDB85DRAFT_1289153 [Lactarius pseudohatsudake]
MQLFGHLFNWALYGVLCVQIYVYSYNFPDDRRSVKFLAYFVFVLETVQTALTGADMYYWFVDGFGDVERLAHSHFSSVGLPRHEGGYFAHRSRILLLSNLGAEQTVVVDLLGHRCQCGNSSSRRDVARDRIAHDRAICSFQDCSICTRTHFGRSGHTTSYIAVLLVMVNTECPGRHSDRGGNDAAGTASLYYPLTTSTEIILDS